MRLYDRHWDKAGFDWDDPLRLLKKYKNVVDGKYLDTTSSAGNWWGYFIVKDKTKKTPYKICTFSQENRYPYRGYKMTTSKPIIGLSELPKDLNTIEDIVLHYALRGYGADF